MPAMIQRINLPVLDRAPKPYSLPGCLPADSVTPFTGIDAVGCWCLCLTISYVNTESLSF